MRRRARRFRAVARRLPDEVTALPQGFIAYMAVEPSLRERGVGAALLAAAEDEARRRGLPYMALMVTEENAAARALYERAGLPHGAAFAVQGAVSPVVWRRIGWIAGVIAVVRSSIWWIAEHIPRTISIFMIAAFIAFGVGRSRAAWNGACPNRSRSRSCLPRCCC